LREKNVSKPILKFLAFLEHSLVQAPKEYYILDFIEGCKNVSKSRQRRQEKCSTLKTEKSSFSNKEINKKIVQKRKTLKI
jgi:hypothetical protein